MQLPGEIRNRIYEYAIGCNIIHIDFETYRSLYEDDKPYPVIIPIFKYHLNVYTPRTNPFIEKQQPTVRLSKEITLLNNVCRQMYLETAVLPFKLNLISFDSHNTMFNFLYMEKRLSRAQRGAITQVALPFTLLEPNMLTYLPNLERVLVGVEHHLHKGWYKVIREEGEEPKLVYDRSA